MDNDPEFNIESLWDHLLSRQPDLIHRAFSRLNPAEQRSILAHLQRMVTETGWHPEQVASARAALDALRDLSNPRT